MSFKDLGAITGLAPAQAQEAEEKLRKHARDDAEADMFLEQCGLKPYTPGKAEKKRAGQQAVIKYPRVGR